MALAARTSSRLARAYQPTRVSAKRRAAAIDRNSATYTGQSDDSVSPIENESPARSPPVSSVQFTATSWTTNSRARVMTVAATAPDWAPERTSPSPRMTATTMQTTIATRSATKGLTSTSAMPNGASGMMVALRSDEMANRAKT